MSKTSTLLKNTAIIGVGTLCTKVLTFLLLPLYTNILNPEDYGLVDVLMTMSFLIIPFATLEINSGVFRFLIGAEDSEKYSRSEIISTGIGIEFIGLVSTLIITIVVNFFVAIPNYLVMISYVISLAVSKLTLDVTRGFGDTTAYSVSSFFTVLISLSLNVVLILVFKWGAISILISLIIGNFSGALFLIIKERIYKYITKDKVNVNVGRNLLKFTLPLIPNTVSWWVASASDRLIVMTFLGTSANGVYAAAHKIPGIFTTLFTVFSIAWNESVARNVTDNFFIEKTIRISVNTMIYMLFGIISFTSLFFNWLIGADYISSYWHIFILLIATFFSSLSSLYGGIFGGKMDSKSIAYTTFIGAVINVIVNLGLVKIIGLFAASLSTMVSYVVISLIRGAQIKKWYCVKLFSSKDFVFFPLGILCLCGFYLQNHYINVSTIVLLMICFCVNNKDAVNILKRKFLK